MKEKVKILIIDDHPMIIDGYQKAILSQQQFRPKIHTAINCDEAIEKLSRSKNEEAFDYVLIDLQLPASSDLKFTSGEDIAVYVRKHFKETKIIILTMIDAAARIENLIQKIPHNGILIKSDVNKTILNQAFFSIMKGEVFYSKSVNTITNRVLREQDFLDEKNIKIIHLLARGVKTNHIPEYMELSLSAVEKRKKHVKYLFDVQTDEDLLAEAKKRGFL